MFSKTLLSTLLLALVVVANPVPAQEHRVTLPLSKHINTTAIRDVLKHDQARARHLKGRTAQKFHPLSLGSEPVTNTAVTYIASVGVGSPPTTCKWSLDRGLVLLLTCFQIILLLIREGEIPRLTRLLCCLNGLCSSNTWVGASTPYTPTGTSAQTGDTVVNCLVLPGRKYVDNHF